MRLQKSNKMQNEKGMWAKTHFQKQVYVQGLWIELITQFGPLGWSFYTQEVVRA